MRCNRLRPVYKSYFCGKLQSHPAVGVTQDPVKAAGLQHPSPSLVQVAQFELRSHKIMLGRCTIQVNLGFFYQNGLGVRLNYAEAYMWFALAANSRPDSRRALEALTQIMTTTQLRDGQARLSEWAAHHNNLQVAAQKSEAERTE